MTKIIPIKNSEYYIEYDADNKEDVRIFHNDDDFTPFAKSGPMSFFIRNMISQLIEIHEKVEAGTLIDIQVPFGTLVWTWCRRHDNYDGTPYWAPTKTLFGPERMGELGKTLFADYDECLRHKPEQEP